ncbi:MAG: hypothetical protein OXC80_11650 [Gammaproteobacteria bacterium]|nr:hypothetical protein [Gammaproteobacteria bacterium]
MENFRDVLKKLISDKKQQKKDLESQLRAVNRLNQKIIDIDDEISLAEKYLAEAKFIDSDSTASVHGSKLRTDRSHLREGVTNAMERAGSKGISRKDLLLYLDIKGDKKAEGYLGTYLAKLQKEGKVVRGEPASGRTYGPYVLVQHKG